MIYGYARVSSRGQERDGNSLEIQEKELLSKGCEVVYKEAFTGTKVDRPVFDELIAKLKPGDTLVVTKLDRFARTVLEGAKLLQDLVNRGIVVDIGGIGRAENTPFGKLMVYILFAIAEFERDMIITRTSEGKKTKRNNGGKCEGRNRIELPNFEEYVAKNKSGELTVDECCKSIGISRTTWYSRLKEIA